MSGGDWECSPYYIPSNSDDIDWGLLKKALFQGIGKQGMGKFLKFVRILVLVNCQKVSAREIESFCIFGLINVESYKNSGVY